MDAKYLIKMVQAQIDAVDTTKSFVIYQDLSMDYEKRNNSKINGVAKVVSGSFESIPGLYESTANMSIQFQCPVEKKSFVTETLAAVAKNVAGVVLDSTKFGDDLKGVTSLSVIFPQGQNYKIGTTGEIYSYYTLS